LGNIPAGGIPSLNVFNQGRYGSPDQQPSISGTGVVGGTPSHVYGQVDFDGCWEPNEPNPFNGGTFGPSDPIALPTGSTSSFPPTNQKGWGNGSLDEHTNHPLLYNYFQPEPTTDRVFSISNMEALLRYGDTNSHTMSSDLFRLCPVNFQGMSSLPGSTALIRNL